MMSRGPFVAADEIVDSQVTKADSRDEAAIGLASEASAGGYRDGCSRSTDRCGYLVGRLALTTQPIAESEIRLRAITAALVMTRGFAVATCH